MEIFYYHKMGNCKCKEGMNMDIVSANAESIVLCKQAVMKIDSAMTDIREIIDNWYLIGYYGKYQDY